MYYTVPNMKLVSQDKTMSCWLASAQMVIRWHERKVGMSETKRPDPSLLKRWSDIYDKNSGLFNAQIPDFAWDVGLDMVPPMSPSPEGLRNLLVNHGPLWVNGKAHITVIAGIRDTAGETEALVYDPSRQYASKTSGQWRGLASWYFLDASSGGDTGGDVQAVFLYAS